jgi:hypothetical protein
MSEDSIRQCTRCGDTISKHTPHNCKVTIMIDDLSNVEKERDYWKERFMHYADHKPTCFLKTRPDANQCSCGLSDIVNG